MRGRAATACLPKSESPLRARAGCEVEIGLALQAISTKASCRPRGYDRTLREAALGHRRRYAALARPLRPDHHERGSSGMPAIEKDRRRPHPSRCLRIAAGDDQGRFGSDGNEENWFAARFLRSASRCSWSGDRRRLEPNLEEARRQASSGQRTGQIPRVGRPACFGVAGGRRIFRRPAASPKGTSSLGIGPGCEVAGAVVAASWPRSAKRDDERWSRRSVGVEPNVTPIGHKMAVLGAPKDPGREPPDSCALSAAVEDVGQPMKFTIAAKSPSDARAPVFASRQASSATSVATGSAEGICGFHIRRHLTNVKRWNFLSPPRSAFGPWALETRSQVSCSTNRGPLYVVHTLYPRNRRACPSATLSI